jgi:hypothetical protein
MGNPWLTSDDLIASVQRKIAMPLSQATFSNDDILAFANEEMMISQVPSVLLYHEEFFVHQVTIPLVTGVSRYQIPDRAIGMRLRDVKWMDNAGNMFDMTRVAPEDKAFFQLNIGANQAIHKFYVEGNDLVLVPAVVSSPTGNLIVSFFLRPNQLVQNAKSATVVGINQTVSVTASILTIGDNVQLYDQVSQNITVIPQPPPQPPGLDIFTAVGVPLQAIGQSPIASFTGIIEGTATSVTLTAMTPGAPGNTITLIFNGTNTIAQAIAAWNFVNTQNQVVLTVGDGTQIPTSGAPAPLTGGVNISIITAANHLLLSGQIVTIVDSNSTPTIIGAQTITVIDANHFSIPYQITVAGTTGSVILQNSVTAITFYSTGQAMITTQYPNFYSINQTVQISGSNSVPSIDGTYPIIGVLSNTQFLIFANVGTPGTSAAITCLNQFGISTTDALTAGNLADAVNAITAIGASINLISATSTGNTVLLLYSDIFAQFTVNTLNYAAITVPTATIGIQFNALPATYTDPDTMVTTPFFTPDTLVDFLQTEPGHQTYVYDVEIPFNGIQGNSIFFPQNSLMVPSGQILNIGGGPTTDEGPGAISFVFADILVGDYMCLANEAIIPQIPPDLHSGLAERTCARILASLGDQAGLQMSQSKITEIDGKQGSLLDNRVEGTPQKITARHSLLRYGKMGTRRRT